MTLLELHNININKMLEKEFEEDLKKLKSLICYQEQYEKFTITLFNRLKEDKTTVSTDLLDIHVDKNIIFPDNVELIKDLANRMSEFLEKEIKDESNS